MLPIDDKIKGNILYRSGCRTLVLVLNAIATCSIFIPFAFAFAKRLKEKRLPEQKGYANAPLIAMLELEDDRSTQNEPRISR
jgi:hypothetical protein